VTGSCFRLETERGQVLIDCGMFQGSKTEKELNYRPFPFAPNEITARHPEPRPYRSQSGLLPKLVRHGFSRDHPRHAGHSRPRRRHAARQRLYPGDRGRAAQPPERPAGSRPGRADLWAADVDGLPRSSSARNLYDTWFAVLPGLRARFWNAGHLLGSASSRSRWAMHEGAAAAAPVLGRHRPDYKLMHPDPKAPSGLDYVICESTYGDNDRIDATAERRRKLLSRRGARGHASRRRAPDPVLRGRARAGADQRPRTADGEGELPLIPIYVDSPSPPRRRRSFPSTTELEEGEDLMKAASGHANVHFTETVEQSKALDRLRGFHIVIAASGMCEAGRIRHRLKNWLWRDEATVLFVGFRLRARSAASCRTERAAVRIQGEEFAVRARIRSLDLYSGHADGRNSRTGSRRACRSTTRSSSSTARRPRWRRWPTG
jgi:metallo-beta-lactamase family protein